LRGKDGDYRWFLTHSVPIVSEEGKIVRWFGTHTDVTEQRSADEEHRRAEKLSAAAQLASSLAHEINNPLQSLTNLLALISYRFATDKTGRGISALAEKELSRITHITKHMLALSRDTVAPTMVKLPEVLEDGLELLAPKLMAKHVQVERRYEYQEEIEGFPGELRQLFARLIDNAVEALPPEGKIILHVSVCRDWKKADRRQIRVVIADNGTGIQSQLLKEIFVPFRTTKERRGTGLGLWVAKNIITRHRGSIRLRSCDRPGRSGTCVAVLLPERSTQHSSKSSVAFVGT
jgi:signal transduction histidine kinase